MTTPLPSYVGTGTVRGKQIVIDIDTAADVDTDPDASFPVGAQLRFRPSVPYLLWPKEVATPYGATTYLDTENAVVSSTGDPVTPTGDVLKLPANLGQTGNDQDWFWIVQVTIGVSRYAEFRFDVTVGVDNYLTDQQPIPGASFTSEIARGPKGDKGDPGDPGSGGGDVDGGSL